jgi:hypothetical protein
MTNYEKKIQSLWLQYTKLPSHKKWPFAKANFPAGSDEYKTAHKAHIERLNQAERRRLADENQREFQRWAGHEGVFKLSVRDVSAYLSRLA